MRWPGDQLWIGDKARICPIVQNERHAARRPILCDGDFTITAACTSEARRWVYDTGILCELLMSTPGAQQDEA